MYNNPFYIPGYMGTAMTPNLMRGISATMPATRALTNTARVANAGGLFSRLGSSLSGIKAINWGGLINNTSKTLGIINQTIPLVRQVGPMVNNMKSMLRVASLFKDETEPSRTNNINSTNTNNNINRTNSTPKNKQPIYTTTTKNTNTKNQKITTTTNKNTKEEYDSSPTFFINS